MPNKILMLCISMQHSVGRRQRMTDRLAPYLQTLENCGIEFRFFDAVDGRALPTHVYHAMVQMSLLSGHAKRALQPGELGCALSHASIWAQMAYGDYADYDGIVILEDDALPVSLHFADTLRSVLALLPPMAFLGGLSEPARRRTWGVTAPDNSHFVMYGPDYLYSFAYAYYVNRAGARLLLDNFLKRPYVADDWASLLRGLRPVPYFYLFEHGDCDDSALAHERDHVQYQESRLRKNIRKTWGDLLARLRVLAATGRLQRLADYLTRYKAG